jgi:lipopolysaccharide biosynthesis protein
MKKILVHIHLYYFEQTDLLLSKLLSIGGNAYDLFVTMCENNDVAEQKIKSFKPDAKIIITKNIGADIYPFIQILNLVNLDDYSYILKLHTKRDVKIRRFLSTKYLTYKHLWRDYLLSFMASKETFQKVLIAFESTPKLGMASDHRVIMRNHRQDKPTTAQTKELLTKNGFSDRVEYVAGTMFMVRAELFNAVKNLHLKEADFSEFSSGTSAQLAHIMEQFLGSCVVAQGYEIQDVVTSARQRKINFMKNLPQRIIVKTAWFFYKKRVKNGYEITRILHFNVRKKLHKNF